MQRREFITLLGGAAAWPLAVRAQQLEGPIAGFLLAGAHDDFEPYTAALRAGLKEASFVEGRNLRIEYRFADDQYDRLPALASDLIKHRVAVIATDPRSVIVAQKETRTVPIVCVCGTDPVRYGLVASLNRPGGNVTGVAINAGELTAKRFGLFHDMVPQSAVIGVLSDPNGRVREVAEQDVRTAADKLGVTVRMTPVATESDAAAAFETFARDEIKAVFVINSFFLFSISNRLSELAGHYRMALSGELRKFAEGGALMSYGPDLVDLYRQTGVYAGRILKGEKPADIPVMQPTKFEFVINLKTAKALGLTISRDILLVADEVIE
jgi:putative ABC transport system substrate-binding protein